MRRAVKRTKYAGMQAIAAGTAKKIYTKRLRKRFNSLFDVGNKRPIRNFLSYAKRSAAAFGPGEKISRQAHRFERKFECKIRELEKLGPQ